MSSTLTGAVAADPSIRWAFSSAADGNVSLAVGAPVETARTALAAAVDTERSALVFMQQVHGSDVAAVGVDDRGRGLDAHDDGVPAVDALVTGATGVALVVQVADCVPVLLAEPGRAIAAVHAGRGGVVAGIVDAAVKTMAPAAPRRVTAVIGPAIGGCCYEVEPELADRIAVDVPEARAVTTWGTAALDLPAAVTAQLTALGISDIAHVGGCTRCSGRRWFSHRREPGAGRHAGVIVRGRRHA